jgi:stage II sporulation protein AA (anti-sigma F factor antagonist)
MRISACMKNGDLYVSLLGEMDECSAVDARVECDRLLEENLQADKVFFNLEGIKFMDSTGIGFLIGRYKKATRLHISMYILNPDFAADKILNLSGIYSLIPKA